MNKFIAGVSVAILTFLIWHGIQYFNNKSIISNAVDVSQCTLSNIQKRNTGMVSRDGKTVYFLQANATCENKQDMFIKMQHVKGRNKKNEGVIIYRGNSKMQTGIWYTP